MRRQWFIKVLNRPEASPGLLQISKIEHFTAIIDGIQLFDIVAKFSSLDVCGSPGYAHHDTPPKTVT